MFEQNEILTYIGMIVVILLGFYYVYKVMKVQHSVIEGLTTKKQQPVMDAVAEGSIKKLKQANEKLSDTFLIGKYRTDYEDMIMDLEQTIDYNILAQLVALSSNVKSDGVIDVESSENKSAKLVSALNELYKLKNNLNETMDFLDSQKAGSSSGGKLSSLF